jgi:hypothetical protein
MSGTGWRAEVRRTGNGESGRLPTAGWIIGASLWLVPVLFFGGNGAWLGFLIIGVLLIRPTWLVAAFLYGAAAILVTTFPDAGARMIASGVLQFGTIIHAMFANRRFLLTVWGRLERNEQWWGRGVPGTTSRPAVARTPPTPSGGRRRRPRAEVPAEAEELLAGVGTDRSDYFADPEPAAPPAPRGRRRTGPPPAPTGAPRGSEPTESAVSDSGNVDVNTATEREFETLRGFGPAKAKKAVEARRRRGRFASVQEFADDLGLQPHELARLRNRLTCSRPRRTSQGRRVDL